MNILPSVMRTGVPIVYAVLLRLGIGDLGLADKTVTNIAAVLAAVIVYAALRGLEVLEPRIGVLLGWIGAPQYATVLDEDLEKWRSATKPELDAALAQARKDIADEVEARVVAALNTKPKPRKAAVKKPSE